MRISDWSSDVCSSDLPAHPALAAARLNHKKQAVAIAEPPDACCCFHSGRRELSHTTKSPTFFPTFPIGHRWTGRDERGCASYRKPQKGRDSVLRNEYEEKDDGGEGGIRTLDRVAGMP